MEIISGKPLEAFFKERIFTPLNMKETSFLLPQQKVDRLVTLYTWDESWNLSLYERPTDSIKVTDPKTYSPDWATMVVFSLRLTITCD